MYLLLYEDITIQVVKRAINKYVFFFFFSCILLVKASTWVIAGAQARWARLDFYSNYTCIYLNDS